MWEKYNFHTLWIGHRLCIIHGGIVVDGNPPPQNRTNELFLLSLSLSDPLRREENTIIFVKYGYRVRCCSGVGSKIMVLARHDNSFNALVGYNELI